MSATKVLKVITRPTCRADGRSGWEIVLEVHGRKTVLDNVLTTRDWARHYARTLLLHAMSEDDAAAGS